MSDDTYTSEEQTSASRKERMKKLRRERYLAAKEAYKNSEHYKQAKERQKELRREQYKKQKERLKQQAKKIDPSPPPAPAAPTLVHNDPDPELLNKVKTGTGQRPHLRLISTCKDDGGVSPDR